MSKKVEVKLNLEGLNELMKSPEMQERLQQAGDAVAAQAASMYGAAEYGTRVHLADYTAIANVYPDSARAAASNHKHNTLVKAVGAVGLFPTKDAGRSAT